MGFSFCKLVSPLHDPGTYRGHLWPILRTNDGGHQIATEGRPGLQQFPVRRIDFQFGAVSGQAGSQPSCQTGGNVPPVGRGSDEQDFRLVAPDKIVQHFNIPFGGKILQQGMLQMINHVCIVVLQVLQRLIHVIPQENDPQMPFHLIGQFPAFTH